MNITENKLYMTQDLSSDMHIADGVNALIYDEENVLRKVTFGAWATLKYFGYFEQENLFNKHFLINWGDNRCEIFSLLSSRGEKITAKINGELASSGSFLDMHIVSFVWENGVIDLDGIVNIIEGIEKVEDDVKAAHACNMERISDDKLFYLRSRGLPREDATVLMLESYIAKIFGNLEEHHKELYNEIKTRILERIKSK